MTVLTVGNTAAPVQDRARSSLRAEVVAVVWTALMGIVARALLLGSSLGFLNSDEATTGIQAKELWRGRAWVFVPANVYGGNAEAWLAAPFEALLPASVMRLKMLTSLTWFAVAVVVYFALRRRAGVPGALLAAGLVWIPSAALVQVSISAYPGYGSGLLATAGVMAIALRLSEGLARPWMAAFLGALAGMAVWQHPLFVCVVAPLAAWIAWHHRESWRTVLAIVAGGVAALGLPLLYNLRHDFQSITQPPGAPATTYPQRVRDWMGDLVPHASGAKWLDEEWILGGAGRFLVIGGLAGLAALAILVLMKGSSHARVVAATALASPLVLPLFDGAWYTHDGRYAVMALVPVAVTLGYGVSLVPALRGNVVAAAALLSAWALLAVAVPFQARFDELPADLSTQELADVLRDHHITRVRGDYWMAYQLTYETDEAIVASPLHAVRFGHHDELVRAAEADGAAALVIFADQLPAYLAGQPPFDSVQSYRDAPRVEVDRWIVFLPTAEAGR